MLQFVAKVERALTRGRCGAEDVAVAAVLKAETLSQLLGCHREIAGGDVGARDACQSPGQFLLVHRGHGIDGKAPSGKVHNDII